jgi:hypothetical protein
VIIRLAPATLSRRAPMPLVWSRASLGRLGQCGPDDLYDETTGAPCPLSNVLSQAATSVPAPSAAAPSGAAVPAGSTLYYSGNWAISTEIASWSSVVAKVKSQLAASGIAVTASTTPSALQSLTQGPANPQPVTLTVQIAGSSSGFSSPSDVASLIDHAAYEVTGYLPQGSSISLSSGPPGSASFFAQLDAQFGLPSGTSETVAVIAGGVVGLLLIFRLAGK